MFEYDNYICIIRNGTVDNQFMQNCRPIENKQKAVKAYL